ncbi:aminotransferase class V-fold PLP-dependent enzyme [Nitrospirillum amazonense]|uniref:Selenocysteine lyase/cysteine desulfurase n=1 Tax=Nitrospirillum amazonense TaxID=28077 RepID=A0A560JW18_9PROT|nr:aminotransferase class V-fold PLP-dependent enzyme [Nitrospirillum amazonense]MDG3440746.1 aminotransferase class V-fold PLP-dependent enzyme [Nitrospirillum amazonense]TWB74919.1 selenocysteine lyase/cysteine desulfurase [Nitrospirillum amazonense]
MRRRTLLQAALAGGAGGLLSGPAVPVSAQQTGPMTGPLPSPLIPGAAPPAADDEAGWAAVAAAYPARLQTGVINLEYGAFGQMPLAIQAAYERYTAKVNQEGATFVRRDFVGYYQTLRQRIAAMVHADAGEIVITRNATESLQAVIGGYARLKPGDAVLMSDHDYDSARMAASWLERRRGVTVISIDLPHPPTYQTLIDAYDQALAAHPTVRLMLLTHLSHRDGLRQPVREIVAMARRRGVDVVVDSAQAWGQGPVDVHGDGVDFAVFNLHKWIGAPLGVGALYIRKDRIADIEPFMGEEPSERDPILGRVHTGMANFAAQMAAIDALDFHQALGTPIIGARLRHLRDLWALPARNLPKIEVLTPDDPRLCAGMTSFRVKGQTTPAANTALAAHLLEKHGLFTVVRTGLAGGACLRVTPGFSTTPADMARLVEALKEI